jgi:hypothetical protein
MAKVTLKKNGNIEVKVGAFAPRIIGHWHKEELGGRDASGNKLVPRMYFASMKKGLELIGYTRNELINVIKKYC